jgi:hypothetical protein
VAIVNHDLLVFVLQILLWWSTRLCILCLLLFALDLVVTAWQPRRANRQARRVALARIDAEQAASIRRLTIAYLIAQQRIRNMSAQSAAER